MQRAVSLILISLLSSLLVVACSSNKEKDAKEIREEAAKAAKLVKFKRTVKAKRLWKVGTGGGSAREFLRLVPAIVSDTIYVANEDGEVSAFDLTSGKKKWKTDTDTNTSGAIGAYHGTVALGTLDGTVVALNAANGEVIWTAKASSEILSAPAVNGSIVVVQTIDARVFAFDVKTGELRWSYDHIAPVLSLRGTSSPIFDDGQVLCAFDNGQLVSFSAIDGSRTWEARISQPKGKTDLERIVDIDGSPVVEGSLVYAGGYQGNIFALTKAQGSPVWKQEISTHNGLAIANGKVFTSTAKSRLIAYNSANGSVAWESDALLNRELGAPTVIGRYLAVIDGDDYLHILSQQDGSFVERVKPAGDGFHAPMITHLGKLYILSDDGKLSAYELSSR